MPRFSRAVFIYNPTARRMLNGQAEKLRQLLKSLNSYGIRVEAMPTVRPIDASLLAQQAVASGCDLVIACGGDGTINEVITGMAKSQVPLMIIPGGTANVLAKEIGLRGNLIRSTELIKTGIIRRISLGKTDHRYFVLMAGIGVDARIISVLNHKLKRKLGEGSFWIAGFKQLFQYHFPSFELRIDGRAEHATFAVISKAKNYGGPFRITSQADLFSDKFDVCLFQSRDRWRYLHYLWNVSVGKHACLPDVKYLKAETVEALGDSHIGVQADGELIGTLPQKFTVETDALSLIVPKPSSSFTNPT
jgi:YegS/Rv2252/BmrU family lipid kinase